MEINFKKAFYSIYLYMYRGEDVCLHLNNMSRLYTLLSVPKFWSFNPVIIKADPFLFVKDDILYLFYEEKKVWGPGKIKMINTKDLVNWSIPQIVLQENFHLSFPFVFRYENNCYMIPETEEDNTIRLYKSENENLTKWSLTKKILFSSRNKNMQFNYSDSCIWLIDSIFYLFTSQKCNGVYQLQLYISTELDGVYEAHPKSPICVSNKYGRNAGAVFMAGNKLYRPSQDCTTSYGANVSIHEITILTTKEYEETLYVDDIIPRDSPIYSAGGHHFNVTNFGGQYVVSTDGKRNRINLGSLFHKAWTLIK